MKPIYVIAGGAVLAVGILAYMKTREGSGSLAYDFGSGLVETAYDVVDGIVSTPILAAGDAIGVPRTSMTECEKAKAEGRTWDASFACPAVDFIKYWWN